MNLRARGRFREGEFSEMFLLLLCLLVSSVPLAKLIIIGGKMLLLLLCLCLSLELIIIGACDEELHQQEAVHHRSRWKGDFLKIRFLLIRSVDFLQIRFFAD